MAIRRPAGTLQSDHVAVVKHGAHPEYRVEVDAPVDCTDENYVNIFQGSIVSIDYTTKGYRLGAANGGVPSVSMKNVKDEDVTTGKGIADRKGTLSAVGGVITAIPVTAGYDIETTEYDKTATYLVGMKLGASSSGLVEPWSSGPVIGFVTTLPYLEDSYKHTRLGFLTHYIPGDTPVPASDSESVPSVSDSVSDSTP